MSCQSVTGKKIDYYYEITSIQFGQLTLRKLENFEQC